MADPLDRGKVDVFEDYEKAQVELAKGLGGRDKRTATELQAHQVVILAKIMGKARIRKSIRLMQLAQDLMQLQVSLNRGGRKDRVELGKAYASGGVQAEEISMAKQVGRNLP